MLLKRAPDTSLHGPLGPLFHFPLRLFADILDDALRETEGAKQPIPALDAAFLTAERTESNGGGGRSRKEEGTE